MPALLDFQFYNTVRLTELFEKDNTWEIYRHSQNTRSKEQVRRPSLPCSSQQSGADSQLIWGL